VPLCRRPVPGAGRVRAAAAAHHARQCALADPLNPAYNPTSYTTSRPNIVAGQHATCWDAAGGKLTGGSACEHVQ